MEERNDWIAWTNANVERRYQLLTQLCATAMTEIAAGTRSGPLRLGYFTEDLYQRLSDEVTLDAKLNFGLDAECHDDYQEGQGMVLYWGDPSFVHDDLALDVVKSIRDLLSRGTQYRFTGGKKRVNAPTATSKHKDPDGASTGDMDETPTTVLEVAWCNKNAEAAVADTILRSTEAHANCVTIKVLLS